MNMANESNCQDFSETEIPPDIEHDKRLNLSEENLSSNSTFASLWDIKRLPRHSEIPTPTREQWFYSFYKFHRSCCRWEGKLRSWKWKHFQSIKYHTNAGFLWESMSKQQSTGSQKDLARKGLQKYVFLHWSLLCM